MADSSGDRKPTSWTARILAPVLLIVVAAAIVLIVSGTMKSDDSESKSTESHASTNGGGCQPPDDIKDAVKAGYYVVQSGDNFTTIADRTCLSEDQLQRLNPNLDPFGLQPQNCVDLVENGCKALAGG